MAIVGLGLLLFALLIGNMQNFLQALGRRRLEMSLRRRDVEQWMSHRRLPIELRRKVREAERYNWAATRGVNEEMLIENLPEDLQREIRRHLFKFVKKKRDVTDGYLTQHIFLLVTLSFMCDSCPWSRNLKLTKINALPPGEDLNVISFNLWKYSSPCAYGNVSFAIILKNIDYGDDFMNLCVRNIIYQVSSPENFYLQMMVRIFALMNDTILDAICKRLRQKIYIKESYVLSRGCLIEKMVFIVRGTMESVEENGIRNPLSEGDVCGEELLNWCLEHSSVNRDVKKIKLPGQSLHSISSREVRCVTNVEAFSIRAADLQEVTSLFPRFFRTPRVIRAIRNESPYWKTFAAICIQVAWRYRKKSFAPYKFSDSVATARGLLQMPPPRLTNRYFLVRAGESQYESLGIINTNPVAKTSVDSGLSDKGKKQTLKSALELKAMGACERNCWIWPSITQRAYQAAEIIAAVNGVSRSYIVPEYSFLDARGLGAYEGKELEAISQVYESDSISSTIKPPPIDDGTPNESVADVFVRVTQLMSILETQYSEDTVIIVSPDSDNLTILQAGLVGLDLRRHSELSFGPGEVRYVDPSSIPTYKQPASAVYKCLNPPNCN
ncbi:hypothetical protein GOBAR_DD07950 [Gossypium barbadense]|nr:hypothetical protein GOBAR_DD07950 [Gossypium barbadense]